MDVEVNPGKEKFVVNDPSSRCNYKQAVVKHYHWLVDVDFPAKVLHCSVTVKGSAHVDGCSHLVRT